MLTRVVLLLATVAVVYQNIAVYLHAWPPITDLVRAHRGSVTVFVAVAVALAALVGWAGIHLLHRWFG